MDDFFTLSKILWTLAVPSNLLLLLSAIGFVMLLVGVWRPAILALALGIGGQVVAGFSPLANYLVSPLEERFPPFVPDGKPVDGIILLGGSEVPDIALTRNVPAVNDAGERVIVFSALSRVYPEAQLVFSGGSGELGESAPMEARAIRAALKDVGVDPDRVLYEGRSRNTAENASFVRAMIEPKPGARWLLVTSAFHMPRAVGAFRAVGFPVIASPVDYRTIGPDGLGTPFLRAAQGLDLTDLATKEWVGLAAYYLTGRTTALFPAP
ncbi:YdcF family protein [Aquabacter sp. P-9]|uniref:YdcF family protein n=1 Tax=Aquabacter sediminis TaxID=3029197 RepID=UPI00237D860A|nr:YdcF family protein [Aquabacter sp. P-9]MDE1566659.1 YdcF family protein [Aquabacter sp. P-9]